MSGGEVQQQSTAVVRDNWRAYDLENVRFVRTHHDRHAEHPVDRGDVSEGDAAVRTPCCSSLLQPWRKRPLSVLAGCGLGDRLPQTDGPHFSLSR